MEKPKTTPKDFFLWAGAMVALFGSIGAFLSLVFDYVNYVFPDALNLYASDPYQNGAAYEMSSFIILGALCLVLLRVIHRSIEKDPTRAEVWVRRWALYLTLFVAGAAITIDLIVLLTTFLNGEELTARFLLKVLLVLFVAAAGFMHFLADLWGYWTQNPKLSMRVTWGIGVLAVVTIAAGFLILGTPQHARLVRFDQQRISDLQQIQSQVVSYWQAKQKLPQLLADMNDALSYNVMPTDPGGGQYEYRATGSTSFELCATFSAAGQSYGPTTPYPRAILPTGVNDNWQHDAGHTCFTRTIDPELYPSLNNSVPSVPKTIQ
jgi:hypothetical protein